LKRPGSLSLPLLVLVGCLAWSVSPAMAAGPPVISATYVTDVSSTAAKLHVDVNPNEAATKYAFEYLGDAALQANRAAGREDFFGAAKVPASPTGIGAGNAVVQAIQNLTGLAPASVYRFRAVAGNALGTTPGPLRTLGTEEPTSAFRLLDGRGWEMVSPVDKGGGAIQGFGASFGGGVFQAAAAGGALTYSSLASFGPNPQGAPAASQYLTARGAGGWSVENLTTPLLAGSYGDQPDGVPYQLFSTDLSRALLSNGERCLGSGGECPVANPPLPGSGAPAGYRNYYLRDNAAGSFAALLRSGDVAGLGLDPARFELRFAGASPDLAHVVLASCAALTADATELPGPGCAPAAQNLYEWSGGGLSLVNVPPGASVGTPGAALAAQGRAVSADGSRVYWTGGGQLFLREGGESVQVDGAQGGGGSFETASADGAVAFFSKAGHLFRYQAATGTAADLTPAGGVQGVLGAAADGSRVYYQGPAGLELWHEGVTTELAPGAGAAPAANYPPSTGAARVSADGTHLAFVSSAELTGYESQGRQEVFLYGPGPGGGAATLTCVSCNPTGERPEGGASIPGAIANGTGADATDVYKPRALSEDGTRVFFDSGDDLAIQDTNHRLDVYQWEASGAGGCARPGGCVGLVSSGRSTEPSTFVDASADGTDAFFLTESSLVPQDPGSHDLYDARAGGGFPVAATPIPCVADACQSLPAAPEDPTPGTLVANAGNPPLHFPPRKIKRHKKHRKGKHRHGSRGQGGRR
jgi:hypothetical protein